MLYIGLLTLIAGVTSVLSWSRLSSHTFSKLGWSWSRVETAAGLRCVCERSCRLFFHCCYWCYVLRHFRSFSSFIKSGQNSTSLVLVSFCERFSSSPFRKEESLPLVELDHKIRRKITCALVLRQSGEAGQGSHTKNTWNLIRGTSKCEFAFGVQDLLFYYIVSFW